MRRLTILIPAIFVVVSALSGCSKKEEATTTAANPGGEPTQPGPPAAPADPAASPATTPAAVPTPSTAPATPEAAPANTVSNAASDVADCPKACEHAFELIKADITSRSGQVPEEFRIKMEKSLERVKPTCLQRCKEGAVNTGCVLVAKNAADIRPCTRRKSNTRTAAPRAIPPPPPANLTRPPPASPVPTAAPTAAPPAPAPTAAPPTPPTAPANPAP